MTAKTPPSGAPKAHFAKRLIPKPLPVVLLMLAACCGCARTSSCTASVSRRLGPSAQGPAVWVVDDGERVGRKSGRGALAQGEKNPLWAPGQPVRLFALPGETVAFQVVVSAGAEPLSDVKVELEALRGPQQAGLGASKDAAWQPIERFVVYELPMARRSGGKVKGESLGWSPKAMPEEPSTQGALPDPLLPVELASRWGEYPLQVPPSQNRVVWIDITVPEEHAPQGTYQGTLEVRGAQGTLLGQLQVELQVAACKLPYRAAKTMLYFEPSTVAARTGSPQAVRQYLQLMHRHQISPVFPLVSASEVREQCAALSGALFTQAQGYEGPGAGTGADVVVIGSYGGLGEPQASKLSSLSEILKALRECGIHDEPGRTDVFLYAVDEQCESPRGRLWRETLAQSSEPEVRKLRVGHTCSEPPAGQAVDLVMVGAQTYDPKLAKQAREQGKTVWVYNGALPQTETFLTDTSPLALRVNAWLQAAYGIERWFYWESTYWDDGNPGGHGPYDPFATAETFHNKHGDWCNGDGVLVYPGTQVVGKGRSLGYAGVLPSIRLKQWRRGISDAGYLQLARERAPQEAEKVLRSVVRAGFAEVQESSPSPWAKDAGAYFEARRKLFEILTRPEAKPLP